MTSKDRLYWEEFLDLYKSMPCLWQVKSKEYYNRDLKKQCYKKMVEKLKEADPNADREKVLKKINVFRTNYKRDLKKVKASEKSGGKIFKSTLWYFEKLQYLEAPECSRTIRDLGSEDSQKEICAMDDESFEDSRKGKCSTITNSFKAAGKGIRTRDTESISFESGDETFMEPSPSKKRKSATENKFLKQSGPKFENNDDASSSLAKVWAAQYGEMTQEQKVFSRTIISDVLYHACLGKLTEKTVEDIHKVLKGVSVHSRAEYVIDDYLSQTSIDFKDEYSSRSSSYSE